MTQLSLIDHSQHPIATQEMLGDAGLKSAIKAMRRRAGADTAAAWPYVERLLNVAGRPAWAVDDWWCALRRRQGHGVRVTTAGCSGDVDHFSRLESVENLITRNMTTFPSAFTRSLSEGARE